MITDSKKQTLDLLSNPIIERAESLRPVKEILDSMIEEFPGTHYVAYGNSSKELYDYLKNSYGNFQFNNFAGESDLDVLIVAPKESGVRTPDYIYRRVYENSDRIPEFSPLFIIDYKSFTEGKTHTRDRSTIKEAYKNGYWYPDQLKLKVSNNTNPDLRDFSYRLYVVRKQALNLHPESIRSIEEGASYLRNLTKAVKSMYYNLYALNHGGENYREKSPEKFPVLHELNELIRNKECRNILVSTRESLENATLRLKNVAEDALEIFYSRGVVL